MSPRVVVVGASLAGLRAVEALRRRGHGGEITLIGDEPHRPYDRPPLSKQVLTGAWPADKTFFRRRDGYEPLDLDMRLGVAASELDLGARRVGLADGTEVSYDQLVIATGTRPRQLPNDENLSGIHVLRSMGDALSLQASLATASHVVLVGAGFIGLEVAAACRDRGLAVTAVELDPLPLAGVLGEPVAAALVELHRARGVAFRTGQQVVGFAGQQGRVSGVELAGGERIAADAVVVGIGVVPNTEWLAGSGLALADGVLCDERCQSSDPNVVAAGDVASYFDQRLGRQRRVEHWTHAVEMANAAATRLLEGASTPSFAPVPYVWSDQYDLKLQLVGHIPEGAMPHVLEGSLEAQGTRPLVVVYAVGSEVTGALTWNRPRQLIALRQAIAKGTTLDAVMSA